MKTRRTLAFRRRGSRISRKKKQLEEKKMKRWRESSPSSLPVLLRREMPLSGSGCEFPRATSVSSEAKALEKREQEEQRVFSLQRNGFKARRSPNETNERRRRRRPCLLACLLACSSPRSPFAPPPALPIPNQNPPEDLIDNVPPRLGEERSRRPDLGVQRGQAILIVAVDKVDDDALRRRCCRCRQLH